MSVDKTRATKRRAAGTALALALVATPSFALVANATTTTHLDKSTHGSLKLTRVAKVPYSTIVVDDPNLPVDVEVVKTEGSPGVKHVFTSADYDGEVPVVSEVVVQEPVDLVIHRGTAFELPTATEPAPEPEPQVVSADGSTVSADGSGETSRSDVWVPDASTSGQYSLGDLQFQGVIMWGGYKFTYYSQGVLPGGGLAIPGRHVNGAGFVADGDGYIVLAAPYGISHGTVFATPFGASGKVYDTCATCSTSPLWLDVYTR